MSAPPGNIYHHIQLGSNAGVLLGNAGGNAVIHSDPASSSLSASFDSRADYKGQYANSSLRPVSTYVMRPRLHQKIKEQLHDQNNDEENTARILVVWGLGGAGKSQLVLHYIREYRQDYTSVFWIEAGSKETIERDYVQIYRLLYDRQTDPSQEIVKVEDAVPAVKRWFQGREGQWLMVLDNADMIDIDRNKSYIDLEYFMPDAPGVHVIVTSRSSAVREITRLEAVEVAEMEAAEATQLFQRSANMTKAGPEATREINKIVEELGYLALAIALAGSYVSVTPRLSSDVKSYLPEYRTRRKELLQRRPKQHIHQYGASVLSTWETSFEAIENYHPAAARLLSLLAFVNFEDIFLGLFDGDAPNPLAGESAYTANGSDATVMFSQACRSFLSAGQTWTVVDLKSAFETLQSYSLIQWKSDQRSYSMHKLVHAWSHDRLEVQEQRQLSFLALEMMATATAQEGIDPGRQIRLVPHTMASFGACSRLYETMGENAQDILTMTERIEGFLYRLGRWSEAHEIQKFHFTKIEIILGKEHPSTLMSMNNLASVLGSKGNYDEAERIQRQALALSERVMGCEHPNTLASINNLASVLGSQGNYEEAERIQRQALALNRRVLGEEHPDTITNMNNLAMILENQGNYKEAEYIQRQALALSEKVMGGQHPFTLTSMNNLAEILSSQGSYNEAERIQRQAIIVRERVLGNEHPDTLASINNLASVLSSQGSYEEAKQILRQTLALSKRVLGKEHPNTLTSMNNLAEVLRCQGSYEEAERIQRQAIAMREKVLGNEHPDMLASLNNLAQVLGSQGKYEEAEGIHRQTLALSERVLGKEHPNTLTSMSNLAEVLNSYGSYEEAERIQRQAIEIRERVLGKEHPDTLASLNNLAQVLGSQGKYEEAEGIHRQTLALSERVLGKEHPSTLTSMNNLASVLSGQDRYEEAETVHRQALAYRQILEASSHVSELSLDPNAISDDDSLPSVSSFAFGASISSQSSAEELLSAAEEFASLLVNDETLKPLYKHALKSDSIGPERFVRNFCRLLRLYSKELKHDAHDRLQVSAAQLVRSRAEYISNTIRAHYDHDYHSTAKEMNYLGSQTSDHARRERLEQYLVQFETKDRSMQAAEPEDTNRRSPQRESTAMPAQDIDEDGELSQSEDDQDQICLPNLTHVKAFLVSGHAFQNLLKNFQNFVQPVSIIDTTSADIVERKVKSEKFGMLRVYLERIRIDFSAYSTELYLNVFDRLNRYWEPSLGRGKIRLRWTCQCGRRLWDDYKELRPGAAEDLRRSLDYYERAGVRQLQDQASEAEGMLSPQDSQPESLPMHSLANSAHVISGTHPINHRGNPTVRITAVNTTPAPGNPPPSKMKFLLLCFSKPNDTLRLFQLDLQHITDDVGLFQMLQATYTSNRGLLARIFSPRKIVSVNFRKFERHPWERVVILSSPDILPCRINPSACHEDHSSPKCDTEYDIHPAPPDLDPYVGRNGLAHLLNSPHEAEEQGNNLPAQNVWLKRFPKKEKTKLTICPPYQYGLGWGIEFVEGWYLSWVAKGIIALFLVAATTFLICWWKFQGDLQGATNMAALLVSYGALLVALISAIAVLPT